MLCILFFFFKQKAAYEMRISDWSSDVCSSDLLLIDGENRIESGNRVEARGWHKGDDDARDEVVEQVALAIEQETQATRSWIDVVSRHQNRRYWSYGMPFLRM